MADPNTPEGWQQIAYERAEDAKALIRCGSSTVGPVYIAGYSVECALKALLQKLGRRHARSGKQGHDLRALLSKAGVRLADISDNDGTKGFFLYSWNTALRYQSSYEGGIGADLLVDGAIALMKLFLRRAKRGPRRKR